MELKGWFLSLFSPIYVNELASALSRQQTRLLLSTGDWQYVCFWIVAYLMMKLATKPIQTTDKDDKDTDLFRGCVAFGSSDRLWP